MDATEVGEGDNAGKLERLERLAELLRGGARPEEPLQDDSSGDNGTGPALSAVFAATARE